MGESEPNPYREILKALKATDRGELLANFKWMKPEDAQFACGCTFGTIMVPVLAKTEKEAHDFEFDHWGTFSRMFVTDTPHSVAFREWCEERGVTQNVVDEVEAFNDKVEADLFLSQDYQDRKARWVRVIRWLEDQADQWATPV